MQKCYKCGHGREEPDKAGFQEVCGDCGSYLHCCLNCRFYDEYAHNHCAEPQAEYISDPNGMNRCEYFVFKESGGSAVSVDPDNAKSSRRGSPDWRNTRGGGSGGKRRRNEPAPDPNRAQNARQKLEELFRKEE